MKYSKIRNKLNEDLNSVRKNVEEARRKNAESEQTIKEMEGVGTMTASAANQLISTPDDNSAGTGRAKNPLGEGDVDESKHPPSTTETKDRIQQPLQQQQQQQQQPQVRSHYRLSSSCCTIN
jgi:ParB-like chromosome segregation protein Spo0J